MSAIPEDSVNSSKPYLCRDIAAIASRWDAKAEKWDQDLQDSSCHLNEDRAYERFLDQLNTIIEDRQAFCAAHGVVDAGCATGLVLSKVISSFAWGVGIDLSPKMIRAAEAKHIPGASFRVGDCFDLSSICADAGAVVSRGVLLSHYGFQHGQSLLRSARSSLVRGGFIFWDFLNEAGRAYYKHSPDNKTYFKAREVCAMALKAGFESAKTLEKASQRVGLLLAEYR